MKPILMVVSSIVSSITSLIALLSMGYTFIMMFEGSEQFISSLTPLFLTTSLCLMWCYIYGVCAPDTKETE